MAKAKKLHRVTKRSKEWKRALMWLIGKAGLAPCDEWQDKIARATDPAELCAEALRSSKHAWIREIVWAGKSGEEKDGMTISQALWELSYLCRESSNIVDRAASLGRRP